MHIYMVINTSLHVGRIAQWKKISTNSTTYLIMILRYKRNSKLQNMKKIIETAPDTHSQFHRNMAEFSDCVPPALQYVSRFHFTFDQFEFPLYPKTIIKQ